MRKGATLLGLRVIGEADGTQLGHVRDLIFDHVSGELLAVLLEEKDLFGLMDAIMVPWSEVRSVGNDVVFVSGANAVRKVQDDERVRGVIDRETSLSGTAVFTADGRRLGTLADMCIDESSGRVLGYEVSGGFIADTLHGKKLLREPSGISLGKDAAVVPNEAELK